MVRIYTKTGDDGTTGLLYGGRVPKDALVMQLTGAVDEAQAAMGVARAEALPETLYATLLVDIERELYVLMAEVATAPDHRAKLVPGTTLVTDAMVADLERRIDELLTAFEMPAEFVVPGANRLSAALDVARTVVRRAERLAVVDPVPGSFVATYLNRLSDLLWAAARAAEGDDRLLARGAARGGGRRSGGRQPGRQAARQPGRQAESTGSAGGPGPDSRANTESEERDT